MRPSTLWAARARRLSDFLDAARDLADAYEKFDPEGHLTLMPVPGHPTAEIEKLATRVAAASGPASAVIADLGMYAQIAGMRMNPVMNWDRFIPGESIVTAPSLVLDFTESAIRRCEAEAEDARDRERGLAGLVGRFARFPTDVREAAGLTSKRGRAAAFWLGVAIQVIGTLIAAVLVGVATWALAHR